MVYVENLAILVEGFYTSLGHVQLTSQELSPRFMMTSSNGDIFCITGHLCGEFPAQKPETQSFDGFFLSEPK